MERRLLWNLRQNGATKDEIDILVQGGGHGRWWGERVELNAMMSEQFIEWIERKLREHGIKKLIPDNDALEAAYRRVVFLQRIQEEEEELRERIAKQSIEVPRNLTQKVIEGLRDKPELAWDEIVWEIAGNHDE